MRASVLIVCLLGTATAVAHPGIDHDIEEASARLRAAPDDPALRLRRAALYRRSGAHSRALADLDEAASRGADGPDVDLERGRTLAAMEHHPAAVAVLTRSLAVRPSWAGHVARGRSYVQRNQLAAARADFDAALALRPQVEVYLERGRLHARMGLLDQAVAGYRDALERLGPATTVVEALVEAELARKHVPAALALIDAQIERSPDSRWFLRRADALAVSGDAPARAAALTRALGAANRAVGKRASAINLVARAHVHLARGAPALAKADVSNALLRAPGYQPARTLAAQLAAPPKSP